jgi:hypothetical protein
MAVGQQHYDRALVVPVTDAARAREAHRLLLHCLMDVIEEGLPAT